VGVVARSAGVETEEGVVDAAVGGKLGECRDFAVEGRAGRLVFASSEITRRSILGSRRLRRRDWAILRMRAVSWLFCGGRSLVA
jgi:hypothetical protein